MNTIDPLNELAFTRASALTRRHFLQRCNAGLGALALGQLMGQSASAADTKPSAEMQLPMYAPKAKQVIYLHMAGSPPQHEMFDYKPELMKHHLKPCPQEFIEGKTFAFIKGRPKLLGSIYDFQQYGESGAWVSETMPHLAKHVDDLCFIKSMHTDQFNHAPAQLLLHTGSSQFGGASMGSWITYGLGSMNNNLPGYMVMVSGGKNPSGGKSLWGSSFLPSVYQGVQCRAKGDPILYVSNPEGMSRKVRRKSLDALSKLNRLELQQYQDPETLTRIEQYELAYRMQVSVPGVMDISKESPETLSKYGAKPGEASFANNCLLARRLIEQGTRFVQLFDWGWDIHGTAKVDDLETQFPQKCRETDQPISALLTDLKERGLLEETLVIWGGEFGRTPMNEARGGSKFLGRDHHPDCFTTWMAGGGVKPGITYGTTDDLGYSVVDNPVHVRDFQATIQHLLGLDPHKHSFPYQGLNQRLIGPTASPKVVHDILA
ncbi:DUF1501 domain-containing protein [Roseibacillus persicicus]|uniref:Sulfatase n=1 Tax=Roseibacillus persicicus TaxID=454148 RepID=A0A918WRA9_9BACT|nr:DUF1501 domain-containing protein [Roseibacillus persicicus]GHC66997.1 sulfatase [Roseibacillus persicicus]